MQAEDLARAAGWLAGPVLKHWRPPVKVQHKKNRFALFSLNRLFASKDIAWLSAALLAPRQYQSDCGHKHYHSRRPPKDVTPAPIYAVSHDVTIIGDQHDCHQQWRRQKTVDDRCQEERANWIYADKID